MKNLPCSFHKFANFAEICFVSSVIKILICVLGSGNVLLSADCFFANKNISYTCRWTVRLDVSVCDRDRDPTALLGWTPDPSPRLKVTGNVELTELHRYMNIDYTYSQ